MKHKEKLEIIKNILDLIKSNKNSIPRDSILKKVDLNRKIFNEYLKELEEKDFIKRFNNKNSKNTFSLTDKGFHYISRYNSMINFIEDFRL